MSNLANDVTGRGSVHSLISKAVDPLLNSMLLSRAAADDIIRALNAAGYVVVPRIPSSKMLENAWADALAEDAAGVWSAMIVASQQG
jgi:threonine/homoserine efflux transporter RhtA